MTKYALMALGVSLAMIVALAAGNAQAKNIQGLDFYDDARCARPNELISYNLSAIPLDIVSVQVKGDYATDDWMVSVYDDLGNLIAEDVTPGPDGSVLFVAADGEHFTVEVINNSAFQSCYEMTVTWI